MGNLFFNVGMASGAPTDAHTINARTGLYRVTGNVSRLGVVGRYKVCLFDKASLRLTRACISSPSGAYEFNNVSRAAHFVVAFDHTNNPVNAAISDYVTPEPMV